MSDVPSQYELDAVAHFVEAVRELRDSPFFIEEHRFLSISWRAGDPKEEMKAQFPDPQILQGMLVPFRRVWLQREPCHYLKVTNILKRYVPEFRGFLDSVVLNEKQSLQFPLFRDISLSVRDVINVWLNTRYHHVGKSSAHGGFTRNDFDRFSQEIGPVLFEFYFLSAVQEAGISFFNISQCAERFLRGFEKRGVTPSFVMGGASENGNVERRTPGFTPDGDPPPQRVWRLRRRQHYDGFNRFLDLIGCTDANAASLLSRSNSFDEFVNQAGITLERTDDFGALDKKGLTQIGGCMDNHPAALRNGGCRSGSVAKRWDGTLVWGEEYVPVLRDQYLEFLEAFRKEPFE